MTPLPNFWPGIKVGAAALDDEDEPVVAVEAPVAEEVALMELLLVEAAAAVKLLGSRWPQSFFSFVLQSA